MDKIYQEYADYVYRYLLSLSHEADISEELLQETFYQAVRCSGKYNGSCKVSSWLCQIAKHLWYQELDRRRRHGTVELQEELTCDDASVEDQFCVTNDKMALFAKVHLLDDISKEVVLLRLTGAFSYREIGDIFGRNENWARVTFYRAKQKLIN